MFGTGEFYLVSPIYLRDLNLGNGHPVVLNMIEILYRGLWYGTHHFTTAGCLLNLLLCVAFEFGIPAFSCDIRTGILTGVLTRCCCRRK